MKDVFKKYWLWILLVLSMVLVISRITYHSDTINAAKLTEIIVKGDLSLVQKTIDGEVFYPSFFPPAFHLIDALVYIPFVRLGLFHFDLNNVPHDELLFVSFLLKFRYLILLLIGFLIMVKVAKFYDLKQRNKIFLLWLLCPILIFVPFSWGNNDVYPTVLLLFFLLFAFKKRNIWAMIFLGLSAAMKNFGLFLIPVAALILADKKLWRTIFYGLLSLLVYLIPLFLYHDVSNTFVTGGGEGLFILQKRIFDGPLFFPLVYFVILLFLMLRQNVTDLNKRELLTKYSFLTLSCFYLTSFFIPHWFLWIMPFFILTVYKDKRLFYLYLVICFTFFISLLTWGRNIDTNLFAIVFPDINNFSTVLDLVNKYFADFKIFDIIYSLFFASFLIYIYILFFDTKKDDLTEKEIKSFSLLPLFVYLLICFIYIGGMSYMRKVKNRDWYDLGLVSRHEVIKPIVSKGSFYQTFSSPKNGLKGVNILFSTYGKRIISSYQLVLYDKDCKNEIRRVNVAVDKILDNEYKEILFDQIEDSGEKIYCFTLEPMENNIEVPLTLNYSEKGSYNGGYLILNEKKQRDDDIVFQLIYPIN